MPPESGYRYLLLAGVMPHFLYDHSRKTSAIYKNLPVLENSIPVCCKREPLGKWLIPLDDFLLSYLFSDQKW